MEAYKNFNLATYIYAYDIDDMNEKQYRDKLQSFINTIHIDKIYIENHRGVVDIPVEKLRAFKKVSEDFGLKTAGGITCTAFVNKIRKPSYFDTMCYTDPAHRKECLRYAKELAQVFDEIILDDFFFTACRCEMCIDAKGDLSWEEYRLKLMEDFSKELVAEAKAVNPNMKFVIKFPNWYESYQECGYNPEKEKDIFDGIYTGTETRTPFDSQHLQRYTSYSIMRLMENTAPGRNGGGWVDLFGSFERVTNAFEQMEATLLGGAKEINLWNFSLYGEWKNLPDLADYFYGCDQRMDLIGKPAGTLVWEPFNGNAEGQIYNYLGMRGTGLELSPYFDERVKTVFCTESTAKDPDSLNKIKAFVRNGGNAVVTLAYYREMYDKGIRDMSSVTLTSRHVLCKDYRIHNANYYMTSSVAEGTEPIMFEVIDYCTNATHANIAGRVGECSYPILTEDDYGKGRFFILNLPDDFADIYKLPREVIATINKHISMGMNAYASSDDKISVYAFDNEKYIIRNYADHKTKVHFVVRGENYGIRNNETGVVYTEKRKLPAPSFMPDAVTFIAEPEEYEYILEVGAGASALFEVKR